jgi:hypothetical protein
MVTFVHPTTRRVLRGMLPLARSSGASHQGVVMGAVCGNRVYLGTDARMGGRSK